MADMLVDNRTARRVVKTLGLPIPLPQKLWRDSGPWQESPLMDRDVVVHATGDLTEHVARSLTAAGANPHVVGDVETFSKAGEAWGRPPTEATDPAVKATAFVFDATALKTPMELKTLYDFFHPRLRSLSSCGRVVVLGRDPGKVGNTQYAATQRALLGFVKSLGREVGKKGSTANLIVVRDGAEARLDGVLRFALSARSAYVTGQRLTVSKTVRVGKEPLPNVRVLSNKTAVVTGAARGIGRSIAHRRPARVSSSPASSAWMPR